MVRDREKQVLTTIGGRVDWNESLSCAGLAYCLALLKEDAR
ncbi:hypothetical protein ACFQI7_06530 [Paenibacillus allorhizosphaerae]|nr:hypothetical protein [Paenibacillus allorhizosphaerae]